MTYHPVVRFASVVAMVCLALWSICILVDPLVSTDALSAAARLLTIACASICAASIFIDNYLEEQVSD